MATWKMGDEETERVIRALSNPNRLALLRALRTPRALAEIDLQPSRDDTWGSDERSITRQAVRRHIEELVAIGVVSEAPGDGGSARYVVNRPRLFAVVEQLRQIAVVNPTVQLDEGTAPLRATAARPTVEGPHLALVRGVEEGRIFALGGGPEWIIGRARAAAVSLDYDPYVSTEHARVLLKEGRFFLADSLGNKNGTLLNWNPMTRGGIAPLSPGDIVGVGMSLLVFRA